MDQVTRLELTVRAGAWSNAHARLLARAMVSDPLSTVETLRASVADGHAALVEVVSGKTVVMAVVLRVEMRELGAEGVIVAAGGYLPGGRLVPVVLPVVEGCFTGCRSIRVHTARAGLVRVLSGFGYRPREVVLSKVIGMN